MERNKRLDLYECNRQLLDEARPAKARWERFDPVRRTVCSEPSGRSNVELPSAGYLGRPEREVDQVLQVVLPAEVVVIDNEIAVRARMLDRKVTK